MSAFVTDFRLATAALSKLITAGTLAVAMIVLPCGDGTADAADFEFSIKLAESVSPKPYTGRLYVYFTKANGSEPRLSANWFKPEPIVAVDVENLQPGEEFKLSSAGTPGLITFPSTAAELDLSGYSMQAVARLNPVEREVGSGAGNGYSNVVPPTADGPISGSFTVDSLVKEAPFEETEWTKLLTVHSPSLTAFYGRDTAMRASVQLPASYKANGDRRYPVLFVVPGFGGTHRVRARRQPGNDTAVKGVEFITVQLDPSCPRGHHVFADSDNNGPAGTALIKEFIPALDATYRTVAAPTARFLTGHSSGGWSTLWLQVAYPDDFNGCWSTAPDPIDFRDFQQMNMYQPGENMYRAADGSKRPLARRGTEPVLWYEAFDKYEEAIGFGGQLHSFEAVFSPRGADGKPLRAWDRNTGTVNTDVTAAWKKYDIRLIYEENYESLAPRLKGKVHVIMGDLDTFYLEGATRLFSDAVKSLGSDAVVELVPGKDHMNLLDRGMMTRIRGEMADRFIAAHPEHVPATAGAAK